MKYQLDFTGKTVLITGAAEGIGKSVAVGFASLGAQVAVLDLESNRQNMEKAAKDIEAAGGKAIVVACDLTNDKQVDGMLADLKKQCSTLDILINNAGIYRTGPSVDYSYDDWDKTALVNVRSHFFITAKIAKQFMIPANKGSIVFLSSTAAHFGVPGAVAYGVSKASTLQMTKALAAEWAEYNIRVNAVNPFFVVTNLISSISQERQAQVAQKTVMKRLATPEDIVGGVLFLCSDMAGYITGTHLNIDGGRTIM